jgi:N-formylglutamate deformylase
MGANLPFKFVPREGPLIISIPHLGQHIPAELRECYSTQALLLEDTDWHLDRLYEFAEQLEATVIAATVSRYVVDLNRPATGESLYPGMITTSLCPSETFRGVPIYQPGREPDEREIAFRVDAYWRPYHEQLKAELSRLRARHRRVLLWEAHSIASVLPRLFTGKLPDFNFGTSDGESCDDSVVEGALEAVRDSRSSWVLNGRFKGGFITRRYGNPDAGVHAIQLEMCQSLYMDETLPFAWRQDKASAAIPTVRASVEGALRRMTQEPQATPPERAVMLSG